MAKAAAEQSLATRLRSQQLAGTSAAPLQAPLEQQQAVAAATVPIHGLQLSSQEPLYSATRQMCPNCQKTRAFFCYDCLSPLMQGIPYIPNLPINIHIVMHGETNAQATGTHAAILAPIRLFRHTDGTSHHRRQPASKLQLPDWDPATTAVLYPEGPETPFVGLWGQLEGPQQQQHWQQHVLHGKQQVQCQCVDEGKQQQQQQQQRQQQQQVWPEGSVNGLQQQLQQQLIVKELEPHLLEQQQCCFSKCNCPGSDRCSSHVPADPGATSQPARVTAVDHADDKHCSGGSSSRFPYQTVVVLEGNWAKARTLLKHPSIAPLPRIQLPLNVRSLFWRRGTGSFRAAVDCGVCTIEAVYLLLKQLQPEPAGKWDDLLWFFSYQRQLVQQKGSYQTRCEMQQNYQAACGNNR